MGKHENCSGENSPLYQPRILRLCKYCRSEMMLLPNELDSHRFCSHECHGLWIRENLFGKNSPLWIERIILICEICGDEFECELKQKDVRRFCSRKCADIWQSKFRVGENNANWQGGISFDPYCPKFNGKLKEKIRKRDNYTCQVCGLHQNDHYRKLDIHHIHYDKENCDPDLISLCPECHGRTGTNRDFWGAYFMANLWWRRLVNMEEE